MGTAATAKKVDPDATAAFDEIERGEQLALPRQPGPIRLVRNIGRGDVGAVCVSRHKVLERDVAVKFLLTMSAIATARASETVEFVVSVHSPPLNRREDTPARFRCPLSPLF